MPYVQVKQCHDIQAAPYTGSATMVDFKNALKTLKPSLITAMINKQKIVAGLLTPLFFSCRKNNLECLMAG